MRFLALLPEQQLLQQVAYYPIELCADDLQPEASDSCLFWNILEYKRTLRMPAECHALHGCRLSPMYARCSFADIVCHERIYACSNA